MSSIEKVKITIALPPSDAELKQMLSAALTEKLGAYCRFTFQKVELGRCRVIALRVPTARSQTSNGKDVAAPSTWRAAEQIIYRVRNKAQRITQYRH